MSAVSGGGGMGVHQDSQQERSLLLRDADTDDLAWVVDAHRAIYVDGLGWPEAFVPVVEGLMAAIAPRLLAGKGDPARRERAWIAEVGGERAGAIFLVAHDHDPTAAKLRMLVVTEGARGYGVGSALVAAVVAFAREAGYSRIELWTEDSLVAARRLYMRAGFHIVATAPSDVVLGNIAETWNLDLSEP
ncbi:MAG: GNAT family N-acetyltransferase [Thermomicrobiales bacterium]